MGDFVRCDASKFFFNVSDTVNFLYEDGIFSKKYQYNINSSKVIFKILLINMLL